jgi:hypothetical protein
MSSCVHHFDPSRLQVRSKFIDSDYAPKTGVVPATSQVRRPLPGSVWHDKACGDRIGRAFSPRRIRFAETLARTIDNPLLAREMILFDEERMYLDTSIELQQRRPKLVIPAVTQRWAEVITASVDAPVDDRFCGDTLLISHHEGGYTWGHYLAQSVPRMLLFLEAFPSGKLAVPAWIANGANGFGEALAVYNISRERIASIDSSVVYRFKQVILLDFLFNFRAAALHPKALPLLRSFPLDDDLAPRENRGAFIKRRAGEKRAIGNQADVDRVMLRHGIDIYGPDEIPLRTQIEIWQSHDLLIATLGSDLTNMVYAPRGARVLALSPHWFGDTFFFELSVAAGVHWHELRCGEMAGRDPEAERSSTFNVDIDLLNSVLTSLLD